MMGNWMADIVDVESFRIGVFLEPTNRSIMANSDFVVKCGSYSSGASDGR